MSKYRQTMAEAYAQVQLKENDYLKSKLNQFSNDLEEL